jgi:hypothetical protein
MFFSSTNEYYMFELEPPSESSDLYEPPPLRVSEITSYQNGVITFDDSLNLQIRNYSPEELPTKTTRFVVLRPEFVRETGLYCSCYPPMSLGGNMVVGLFDLRMPDGTYVAAYVSTDAVENYISYPLANELVEYEWKKTTESPAPMNWGATEEDTQLSGWETPPFTEWTSSSSSSSSSYGPATPTSPRSQLLWPMSTPALVLKVSYHGLTRRAQASWRG